LQVLKEGVGRIQDKQSTTPSAVSPQMVVTEALKLFFNLALVETSKVDEVNSEELLQKNFATKFEDCISCILELIRDVPLSPSNTLSSPLLNAIHALLHVPYAPRWDQNIVTKLTDALILAVPDLVGDDPEENIDRLRENKADDTIAPLLLVLRRTASNSKSSRESMAEKLLPSERFVSGAIYHFEQVHRLTRITILMSVIAPNRSIREITFLLVWCGS
jgi:hypothetical protein